MLIVVSGLNFTDREDRFARGEAGSSWLASKGVLSAADTMAEIGDSALEMRI